MWLEAVVLDDTALENTFLKTKQSSAPTKPLVDSSLYCTYSFILKTITESRILSFS